jgi:hypothetical protein
MEQVPCVHCGKFFIARNRKQNYGTEPDCQRARKAAWQRYKMKTDADYRTQQQLSNEKWVNKAPGYKIIDHQVSVIFFKILSEHPRTLYNLYTIQ